MARSIVSGDQKTIERIRLNDRKVMGELYLKFEKMAYAMVAKHGGREEDSSDLLQETIVILWHNVIKPEFRLTAKLSTYFYGIMQNKWREMYRRNNRLKTNELDENTAADIAEPETSENEEEMLLLNKAMKHISDKCNQLFGLYYFEKRKMNDIATIMGFANADTAKAIHYKCKKHLQDVIREMQEGVSI
jgi:RNA polymerase sigma factor (sigma-70 family)